MKSFDNNKSKFFARSILAVAISSSMFASGTYAAEEAAEEIIVTGIRASVQRAMDIKRDAAGVVDAISAEDIGKFPDTNLAESLQRITGVSISRSNGEGSQITVRGFGGSNNMVTLNGRTLPGGGVSAGYNAGTTGRAFDFGNLASESISGVEVYKTGRASITTGGIGASVNIITTKPIKGDGFKATLGGKLLHDTTNEAGDDVTPELSGLVSFANDENTLGVSLSASHQVRDSGQSGVSENGWTLRNYITPGQPGSWSGLTGTEIVNAPAEGQLYAIPNDLRYHFFDNHRVRDNAQLTLQYKPIENLVGTLDYTYAKNDIYEERGDKTVWFQGAFAKIVFDKNPVVASPSLLEQTWNFPKDNSYAQAIGNVTNELEDIGVNFEYQATDRLKLSLDAHDSSLEGRPNENYGSSIRAGMAVPIGYQVSVDFSKELPKVTNVINDSVKGNNNGIEDMGDLGSTVFDFNYVHQKVDITQIKLDGEYEFDAFKIAAGIETRDMQSLQQQSAVQYKGGDNSVIYPGDIPASLIENYNYVDGFDDINTSSYSPIGFRANALELATWAAQTYGSKATPAWTVDYNHNLSTNNIVAEDTAAGYVELGFKTEVFSMPINLLAGVRHETTDVDSRNSMLVPTAVKWTDNNDFLLVRETTPTMYTQTASYSNTLPSLDVDVGFTDELKGRFSVSKTMSRAGYGSLVSGASIANTGGLNLPISLGGEATASAQNPGLLPLESKNLDLSLEYYFADTSYVSVGYFKKDVENFIGSQQVMENHFGLRDVTSGPRAEAARAALQSRGQPINEDSLFVMTAILDNPQDFPTGADAYKSPVEDASFWGTVAAKYDVLPNSADPLLSYKTSKPVNNKTGKIDGWEIAAQHFFSQTGFGIQANYTMVNGDVTYDNSAPTSQTQFVLTGLSDTANIVFMYEKDALQTRIAYNWRDKYLASSSNTNPTYVRAYAQIDANLSYEITDNLTISIEGLNLTGEDSRSWSRTENMIWNMYDLGPRYALGARYDF